MPSVLLTSHIISLYIIFCYNCCNCSFLKLILVFPPFIWYTVINLYMTLISLSSLYLWYGLEILCVFMCDCAYKMRTFYTTTSMCMFCITACWPCIRNWVCGVSGAGSSQTIAPIMYTFILCRDLVRLTQVLSRITIIKNCVSIFPDTWESWDMSGKKTTCKHFNWCWCPCRRHAGHCLLGVKACGCTLMRIPPADALTPFRFQEYITRSYTRKWFNHYDTCVRHFRTFAWLKINSE